MKYAGFWPRCAAGFIDFSIFIPLMLIENWINSHSYAASLLVTIPYYLSYAAMNIFCLAQWGQTPGKMVMKISVRKIDGTRIGYREAVLRHSVDLAFAVITALGMVTAMRVVGPDVFTTDYTFATRTSRILEHLPWYARLAESVNNIWVWSELLVLLFNDKRRAIHDFIAGTIVMRVQ